MQEAISEEAQPKSKPALNKLALIVWCTIAVAGHLLITRYSNEDELHNLRLWEQRLTMVAQSQSDQIATLLAQKSNAIAAIAENTSVQLYLSTVNAAGSENDEADMAFLRNYILAVAAQSGLAQAETEAASIGANVNIEADAGLAIIRADGAPVVSTRHFPALGDVKEAVLQAKDRMTMIGPNGQSGRMWMAARIHPVQGDANDEPVGFVVASFMPLPQLDEVLAKGELPDTPATSRLVTLSDQSLKLIAPTTLREKPMQSAHYESIAAQTHQQRDTLIDGRDETGERAFGYAKEVKATPWSVVRQVSRQAALEDTLTRANRMLIAYWLAVGVVTMTAVALWRHMTVAKLGELLRNISQHERLLETVTKHIPAALFIIDSNHRFHYVNDKVADNAKMQRGDIRHKTLQQVMGAAAADPYLEASDRVIRRGKPDNVFREQSSEGKLDFALETQYIPLSDLPPAFSGDTGAGVLIIEQDLTDIMRSKYAQQQTLNKLIETIVALADMRDPNAKRHSVGVVMIARAIAETMQIERTLIETVTIAGQLMNLGKLFIPRELLTSNAAIDDKDKHLIADSMQQAINHLSGVPFEGPVVETLKQVQEKVNGSGPMGLRDEQILVTAKIIAVANSFVAITSPRAYREKRSIPEALEMLQKDAGAHYAAAVITALAHYLTNLGGAAKWHKFNT